MCDDESRHFWRNVLRPGRQWLHQVAWGCLCGFLLGFVVPTASGIAYDVFVLAGQSNMDGRAFTNELTGGFAFWNQPQTNVLIYYSSHDLTNYTASWQTLKPGWSTGSDGASLAPDQFGPELSIGYVLASANPGRHVALIKISKGGTSIDSNWKPGKDMYANLTNAVPVALQALAAGGNTYTVRGLLWHQGEADYGETHDYYLNLLTNFIGSVRIHLGLPNLPFVIGEITRDNPNPNYQIIRQAQYDASQIISNGYFVSAMNLPADTAENHFAGPAVIGLGQRFGSQASALLGAAAGAQTWVIAGSGSWSTGSARWTTNGGMTTNVWNNGGYSAAFNASSSGNSMISVSNGINAYGLTIGPNATGYSFTGGTLTVGNGGISANESVVINSSVNVGGLQTWSVATDRVQTLSGPINLSIQTLNISNGGTTTVSGIISDVSSDLTNSAFMFNSSLLSKTGDGTLSILNSNSFTGGTMIRNGSIQLGDGVSSNGVILGNIDNNATLTFANPFVQSYDGIITGTGTVIKTGAGALSITGSNIAYSGDTIVNGGTISIAADNNLGVGSALVVSNAAVQVTGINYVYLRHMPQLNGGACVFDINSVSNDLVANVVIGGNGDLVKAGSGTLTLAVTPTYSGVTRIKQGTLVLDNASLTGAVSVEPGAILALPRGLRGEYYNAIAGTNNFSSVTALNSFLSDQAITLLSRSGNAGPNFDFGSNGSGFPMLYRNGASFFVVRWTGKFRAPLAGTYYFDTTSDDGSILWIDGNLVVNNNFGSQALTTRSGTTTLTEGLHDIVIGYYQFLPAYGLWVDVALPGGSTNRLPNSLLSMGAGLAIGSLNGDPGSQLVLGNDALTINQTVPGVFAGNIGGTGNGLIKAGWANLTLSGSNTFTGGTAVNSGTLTLDYISQNNGKISATDILTLNGGTLKVLGNPSSPFTQQLSGLFLPSNGGASEIVNQSGNTVLDFASGILSPGNGVSVNFRITGGAGIRLPGTTNTLLGVWAVADTGDPAFLDANNYVVPLTNYAGVLPAAGANPGGNYLNTTGSVTASETANILNFRDAPSFLISSGAVLHLNSGLLFPGQTALSIGGGGQLGASNAPLVIHTSAVLGANALRLGSLISSGSGSLNKLGAGTLIIITNNAYTGGTTINGGILQVGDGSTSGALGPGSITDNGTLVYNRGDDMAITNSISGSGVLVQAGTNTLSINTPQSYMGGTIVNNGILLVNCPGQNHAFAPNSSVTVNGGGSVFVTNVNNVWNDVAWKLNGGLVKIVGGGHQHFGSIALNGGTMTTGPGSYAYDYTAGNYAIDGNVVVGGTNASVLDANSGINLGASVVGGAAVTFNVADATGNANPDLLVATRLRDSDGGGARGLIKAGAGNMLLNVANDYTGSTTISNGVLTLGHALAAQSTPVNNWTSGGLAFANTNVFVLGGLAGNGDVALSNANGTITLKIGNNGSSAIFSGGLRGSGALTKIGAGTLKLTALSTYGGVTTISNGTLALSGWGTLANSSAIVVVSNATLDVSSRAGGGMTVVNGQTLGGSGIVTGNVTLADGATLAPGTSVGSLTFANDLVVGDLAALQYEMGASNDTTSVAGNLTLGGILNISNSGGFTNGSYTLFTYGGTLAYHGIVVGTRPDWSLGYIIDTNTAGQVRLTVTNGSGLDPFTEWQSRYFTCTNCPQAAASADPDGDGQNNFAEYLAGTSPTNSMSTLRIIALSRQGNDMKVTWMTVGGKTNALQVTVPAANGSYSTNFADLTTPPHIITIGSADVITNVVDPGGATNTPARFYRVRLVP
jgi:fibronectin-binding autotransporter adhesin